MIGAPFGLFGTVIGGISGGAIGKQIVEGAEVDDKTASKNSDESNNNSINK
jgi:Na+/glutamate symporter